MAAAEHGMYSTSNGGNSATIKLLVAVEARLCGMLVR